MWSNPFQEEGKEKNLGEGEKHEIDHFFLPQTFVCIDLNLN